MDSKPFHPDTYVGPDQDDDEGNTEMMKERSLSIKLEAENTVRWRWTKDEFGNDVGFPFLPFILFSNMSFRLSSPTVALFDGLTVP